MAGRWNDQQGSAAAWRVRRSSTAAVLGILPILGATAGAQTLTIDLADQKPGEHRTISISPATEYRVHVTNKIPFRTDYTYTTLLRTKPIPALDASVFGTTTAPKGGKPVLTAPQCAAVQEATDGLTGTLDEAAVPKLRTALKDALDAAANVSCTPDPKLRGVVAVADTEHTLEDPFSIREGQTLEVTITRTGADGKPLIWTKTFDAGDRGEWRTSYGFTFIPNEDERWFAKPGTEANKFTITQKAQRLRFDFAPSIFFTWVPGWKLSRNLDLGPTAGLGFDLSAPIVFAGLSVLWNENIALIGGIVAHRRDRLSGEFEPGQTIMENLSSDKLTEKTYHLNGFFGLAFRFGSKPKGFGEPGTPAPAASPSPNPKPSSPSPAASPSPAPSPAPTPQPGPSPSGAAATGNLPLAQPASARPPLAQPAGTSTRSTPVVMVWVNLATWVYTAPARGSINKPSAASS